MSNSTEMCCWVKHKYGIEIAKKLCPRHKNWKLALCFYCDTKIINDRIKVLKNEAR